MPFAIGTSESLLLWERRSEMSFTDKVQKELQEEQSIYDHICKELKKIPVGTLSVSEVNEYKYFTAQLPKNNIRIGNINCRGNTPKSRKIISELTARYCIEKMKSSIEHNKKLLCSLLDGYLPYDPNILLPKFPKAYKEITDGIFSHTGFVNYASFQDDNPPDAFRNDGRINRTASGVLVRSKSEMAIADNYSRRGDLFIYEGKLILPDGTILHPDFKIYIPELRKYRFHEHLGLPTDPKYMASFLWKEQKYIEYGIYPNRDLLITIEEPGGGIDMEKLNQMLDWFLA